MSDVSAMPQESRAQRPQRAPCAAHAWQPAVLGRPYIMRNIPTYDILSEENLVRIEQTADRILAEIGIEFRDDPVALDHWRTRRRQARRQSGHVRAGHAARDIEDRARDLHPACAQPGQLGRDRRQERSVLAGLRLALRHGYRQGPTLRHDSRLRELREAGAVLALAAPFGRHDLRAGGRAGQQAPSRHGLHPYPLFGPRLHGLGDGRGTAPRIRSTWRASCSAKNSSTRTASSSAISTSIRRWCGMRR